ncbi:hypothetical protein [Undibacterium parvum]|uniref:Uncharacterized protein n=3 Tax=Undibacterium TaxID=401469 RepID=A0A6M4A291_9BURK|nr:hypothetical protein [Undibacterium parvum]AZP10569.1 hypothetical protein EJN92_00080 [Undibacterium parvum]QJQ05213.1 hypothetical protein EJG51_004380 [Undibacterium piscinae]
MSSSVISTSHSSIAKPVRQLLACALRLTSPLLVLLALPVLLALLRLLIGLTGLAFLACGCQLALTPPLPTS